MPRLHAARTAAALMIVLLGVLAAPTIASASSTVRLVIGFAPTTSTVAAVATTRALAPGAKASAIGALRSVVVRVDARSAAAVRQGLLARADVAWVERDHVARAYDLSSDARSGVAVRWNPNDSLLSSQWNLAKIGAADAWELARGTGVTVAVVDTGVDYVHPDLGGSVDLGPDYVDGDADPMDEQGHGTHVSGIIAAKADDAFGVAGIAPSTRILAIRALDAAGKGNYSDVAKGIVYASQHGARVINLSLGGPEQSNVLHAAIDYAAARGAVVTCASGNEGATALDYPGIYESCLSVGASNEQDLVASFSNRGPGLDLVAPGTGIISSVPGGSHEAMDGTSMASPAVAGAAALLYSQGLHRRAVVDALLSTARDIDAPGRDTSSGAGRLDAGAAVQAASRMPRAVADTAPPTIDTVQLKAARIVAPGTPKVTWRVVRRTPFRRVGTSYFMGSYQYDKTVTRGATRTISTFRYRRGIVYRRDVVQQRQRGAATSATIAVGVSVAGRDDTGIDRMSVDVDGSTRDVDWSIGDGWKLTAACTAGAHRITLHAWDAADNETSVERSFTCR